MKHSRTEGVAYVEFLLVFIPIFLLFMGVAQLGLLFGARLLVHHAANRAVRSAVVVLDDTPRYYGNEPRGYVSGPALATSQLAALLSRMGFQVSTAQQPMLSRRATIEAAAALPLVPLAPRGLTTLGGSLESKGLSQSVAYTLNALSLDIPVVPKTTPLGSVASTLVTVLVSYRYACGVPIAGKLVCPSGSKVLQARASLPVAGANYTYR
ncbi:MAG: pilus assembly protein [Myxococcales bacterium]|nr:pilus assembly protein [Myxococcales bacterium]